VAAMWGYFRGCVCICGALFFILRIGGDFVYKHRSLKCAKNKNIKGERKWKE